MYGVRALGLFLLIGCSIISPVLGTIGIVLLVISCFSKLDTVEPKCKSKAKSRRRR